MRSIVTYLTIALAIASFVGCTMSQEDIPLSDVFVDEADEGPVALARAGRKGRGGRGNEPSGIPRVMANCTEDGVFAFGRCSRTYFECQAGAEAVAQECPEGEAFNNVPGAYGCLPVSEVEDCTRATQCRRRRASPVRRNACEQVFANCTQKGEAPVAQACENGKFFSAATRTCEEREDVPECTSLNPKCAEGPGNFAVNKKRRYRSCATKCGDDTVITCPRRTKFNPDTQACE